MAWDLLINHYKLDVDKLWVTIFEEDDESGDLWKEISGLPDNRIQKMGAKDNFWSMGDTGPCGPCTEIHYDHGPEYGDDPNGPAGETDRYVEIWNLVFMQYNRDANGAMHPLTETFGRYRNGSRTIGCYQTRGLQQLRYRYLSKV